jgi:hypothetical protein
VIKKQIVRGSLYCKKYSENPLYSELDKVVRLESLSADEVLSETIESKCALKNVRTQFFNNLDM